MADTESNAPETETTTDRPVAVITGASSGIGMATALEFAKQGYNLVLAARRQDELQKVAGDCEQHAVITQVVPTDTTDDAAVQALANKALERFGHIDVWVNDAGVYLAGKFEDVPIGDMRRVFDTNFFGYVYGSRAALNAFRKAGKGVLINVSSLNATAPQPYLSIYSASKAAIRALDEALRMELRMNGEQRTIHVCTVMPASVDTNLFQNSANYTGQEVQAPEPVYDPQYVAAQIAKLAKRPRREVIIGPVGKLIALQNACMPRMYERRMTRYTKADLLSDRPTTITKGNLYDPIEKNQGMRGGWHERRMNAEQLNKGASITAAAAVGALLTSVGIAMLVRKQKAKPTRGRRMLHAMFS